MTNQSSNKELKNRLNLNLSCDNMDKCDDKSDKNLFDCEKNRLGKLLLLADSKLLHADNTSSMGALLSTELRSQTETLQEFESAEMMYAATGEGADDRNQDTTNDQVQVTVTGVLLRLVLPLYNGVYRSWHGIREIKLLGIIGKITKSRSTLASFLASTANMISLGLSSVQVSNRIDPLLRVIKFRRATNINIAQTEHSDVKNVVEEAEKCVELKILAEPPPGEPIKADIIFIHGLHGSQVKTWRQGCWNSEGRIINFERPPKPPVRPPKRPRYTRPDDDLPAHHNKRRRFFGEEDEGFSDTQDDSTCSTPTDEDAPNDRFDYDNVDNFRTFRLRIDDLENEDLVTELDRKDLENTGTKRQIDENLSKCWPADWIPLDCPGVRVIALNYTTDPYLWRPIWIKKHIRTNLPDRSREMTDLLIEKGVGQGHPIIWVGHSKGGIFIKKILVDAWESGRQAAADLWRSSRGVFFYSVPHRGSILASLKPPLTARSIELIEIQKNSPKVLELHRQFVALYRSGNLKIELFSFVETALTFMSFLYIRIIGIDSADPGIGEVCGVQLDHREICKPRNRDCILYTELVRMIKKITS